MDYYRTLLAFSVTIDSFLNSTNTTQIVYLV
jgi:hypothetical protein